MTAGKKLSKIIKKLFRESQTIESNKTILDISSEIPPVITLENLPEMHTEISPRISSENS